MTEQEAVEIARQLAKQEGWGWVDPAFATLRRPWFGPGGRWEIFSNRGGVGTVVRVVIDDETGRVLEKGYVPR